MIDLVNPVFRSTVIANIICLFWAVSSMAAHAETSSKHELTLPVLITERLGLMKDVAAYKWVNSLPVEDTAREAIVIDNAILAGLQYGVTAETTEKIFTLQINAAKEIQHCWIDHWQSTNGPSEAPDLAVDIRPELIRLGDLIMMELSSDRHHEIASLPPVTCLSSDTSAGLVRAFNDVRYYADRLAQVMDSRILRVGTTGDYRPFSKTADFQQYDGIDIDLARRLADSLKVEARFVRTSWPDLSRDMIANRFDVAMSGISIIESRKKIGFFTRPYHIGGKSPITRCNRTGEFNSLEKIDQPGTRLIVNPGGTNERFIGERITHATKILHNDNRTIFKALLDGEADLMITDLIEVMLQSNLEPELCPSMPGKTLTYQEKGIFLVQDKQLLGAVDSWLVREIESGSLDKTFEKHLTPSD